MKRFVEGADRGQSTLFPECLEDWIGEDNPVRVIDVFVEELDLGELGFNGVTPEATGRPSYHPSVLLKLYIYGYVHRVQSSRRLEREAGHNVEVMWLVGRLIPDHKTIADFRKDNGTAIRKVCARFIALCRTIGLLTQASAAIDGSKFKAVNNRDRNFTRAKMEQRMAQIEESVARYLQQLDTTHRQEPSEALKTKTSRLKEKIEKLKKQVGICAPRDTPDDIVDKLNKEINTVIADAAIKMRLVELGAEPMPMTPELFGILIADAAEKWGTVIRAANIKAE
jgi:transposase